MGTATATASLYDNDFYGWTQRQAETLRARDFSGLDVDNLIEEILNMGGSEQRELESRLEVLLMHLLKWVFQPDYRGTSWELTIKEQRRRIVRHLRKNPSLKPLIPESSASAYEFAVLNAARETGLKESTFPATNPWTFEQIISDTFWPEDAATGAMS